MANKMQALKLPEVLLVHHELNALEIYHLDQHCQRHFPEGFNLHVLDD